MSDRHLSTQFDAELSGISTRVLEMGGMVESQVARIARTVQRLVNSGVSTRLRLPVNDLAYEAELAVSQLRKALDAFARLDVDRAVEVLKRDDLIDQEFEGLLRKLITFMMEDARTISSSIDLIFVAKAIERVGDYAKNLAEQIIYIVKGTDVRHNTRKCFNVPEPVAMAIIGPPRVPGRKRWSEGSITCSARTPGPSRATRPPT